MSVDRIVSVRVGFVLSVEEALAPFSSSLPEESHMEKRFDPKTGKEVASVKVVDRAKRTFWTIDGQAFDDEFEAVEVVAKKAGCDVETFHEDQLAMFLVGVDEDDDGFEGHGLSVGGGLAFQEVVEAAARLEVVRQRLAELGIEPGLAKVKPIWTVG